MATPNETEAAVEYLAAGYSPSEMPAARCQAYRDDLCDLPPWALVLAIRYLRKARKACPGIGDIREAAVLIDLGRKSRGEDDA